LLPQYFQRHRKNWLLFQSGLCSPNPSSGQHQLLLSPSSVHWMTTSPCVFKLLTVSDLLRYLTEYL
jgi:hypothetical protein